MLERALLAGLAMLWLPGSLRAEEAGTVAVGTRVRVTSVQTGARPLIGQVVALEPGVLVVVGEGGDRKERVPVAPSTTLEVSRGVKSQARRGAIIGAGVGAMPGLLMTFGDYNTDKGNPAAVSLVGAAAGAAIGALVGLAFKSENWLPADVPVVAAGIAPLPRGAAISVSVAWGRGSPSSSNRARTLPERRGHAGFQRQGPVPAD